MNQPFSPVPISYSEINPPPLSQTDLQRESHKMKQIREFLLNERGYGHQTAMNMSNSNDPVMPRIIRETKLLSELSNYDIGLISSYHKYINQRLKELNLSEREQPDINNIGHRTQINGVNNLTNQNNREEFIPSPYFQGKRNGFVFKTGQYGLGYYKDNSKIKSIKSLWPISNIFKS